MCSVNSVHDRVQYTRNCTDLIFNEKFVTMPNLFSSPELEGAYQSICPYDPGCGSPGSYTDAGACQKRDLAFTFVGQVGRVTAVDYSATIPSLRVTFNDGRTDYSFIQRDAVPEYRKKSMYGEWVWLTE